MNFVFFHYPCNDGLMAALAAYRALGSSQTIYYGVDYNVEENVVKQGITGNKYKPGEASCINPYIYGNIYFVDYFPSVDTLIWFYNTGLLSKVIVIDHHASGFERLAEFCTLLVEKGVCKEDQELPFVAEMSYEKSGALLTYDYFVKQGKLSNEPTKFYSPASGRIEEKDDRTYFEWASIRDLFLDEEDGISQKVKLYSNGFTNYLAALRSAFSKSSQEKEDKFNTDEFCLGLICFVNAALNALDDQKLMPYIQKVEEYEDLCHYINKAAHLPEHNPEYSFVNCMHSHASTACYFLYKDTDRPYAVAYQIGNRNGVYGLTLNFRCRKTHSIIELAKKYGGGGHERAAGAFIPADREDFLSVVKEVLEGTMRID